MKIEATNKKISTTYLVSMTDVIFLLLIFLMLASNFITQTGINIRLPGSSSGVQHNLKTLEVIYTRNNLIIINNIQMDIEQFRNILPAYYQSKEQVVRLVADKEVRLQDMINIMDIIRNSGFDKITIATYKVAQKVDESPVSNQN
jgi:biopolymer transport protein ExbD